MKSKSLIWIVAGVLLLSLCIGVVSAVGVIDWQKALGGSGADIPYSVQQTSDGGYILTGYTESNVSGDVGANHGDRDVWVVKTDVAGSIQWQKVLGSTMNQESYRIQQTSDGGYILTGTTDGWATEDVDFAGWSGTSGSTSLVFDADGNPHISYYDETSQAIKHAWQSGGVWTSETVDGAVSQGQYTSLAYDGSGILHMSYANTGATNSGLHHAWKDGGGWHTEIVDPDPETGGFSSLKIDHNGYVSISYYKFSNPNSFLKYANYDKIDMLWVIDTVATTPGQNSGYTSLAFDAGGFPAISYYTAGGGLQYASKSSGSWVTMAIDSTGLYWNSLAFDPSGNPHITYQNELYQLKHTWRDAGVWQPTETVDPSGGEFSSLAFDASGNPHVSYEAGKLKHAWKDVGGWHTEIVDSTGSGWYTSLAFDPSGNPHGNPHISYFDMNIPGGGLTHGTIKHAWWMKNPFESDVLVVKLDSTGTTEWQKVLGGNNWEDGYDIKQTSDGGYVLLGRTTSSNSGNVQSTNHGGIDFWLVKLDSAGSILAEKALGGTGNEEGYGIQQTSDGGYILVGTTTSSSTGDVGINHGGIDIWVVKLTHGALFNWEKVLGGSGDDIAWRIQQTSDGGYILVGWTTSSSTGDVGPNHGGTDAWVVKLDGAGNIVWQKVLGGTGFDIGKDVKQTIDGGYIIAGSTGSSNSGDVGLNHGGTDAWVVKLDSAGAIQWQNVMGGSDDENGESIQQTSDHGYIVTGYTSSSNSGDVGLSHGVADFWLVKLKDLTPPVITKDQAVDEVIATVLSHTVPPQTALQVSNVYVDAGTDVKLLDGTTITNPLGKSAWVVVIDPAKNDNLFHPVRYVFVNNVGVSSPPIDKMSPPAIASAFSYSNKGHLPNPAGRISSQFPPAVDPACPPDATNNYALLISGGIDKDHNYVRYYDDIAFMYKTLVKDYGYNKNKIKVLMSDGSSITTEDQVISYDAANNNKPVYRNSPTDLDGDGSPEVWDTATKAKVIAALDSYTTPAATALPATANLFIFTTSHGASNTNPTNPDPNTNQVDLYLWGTGAEGKISDSEFVAHLPAAPKISMMMQQCNGGGFKNNFIPASGSTRVLATAAQGNEVSKSNDFSYYWITGVAGHDSLGYPANADVLTGNIDNQVSMFEAYDYAYKHDPSQIAGLEHPTWSDYVSDAGKTQPFSACAANPPAITVTLPPTTPANTWKKTSSYKVTWSTTGTLPSPTPYVKIQLMKGPDPGMVQADLSPTSKLITAGSTGVTWKVPVTLNGGPTTFPTTDYWIKISTVGIPSQISGKSPYIAFPDVGTSALTSLMIQSLPNPGTKGALIDIQDSSQKPLSIYINNQWVPQIGKVTDNNCAYTFNPVASGTYSVKLAKTCYYNMITPGSITVIAGTPATKPITLNPMPVLPGGNCDNSLTGSIAVTSLPEAGYEVFLDGTDQGYGTPVITEIGAGLHTVKLEMPGYVSQSKDVTVTAGQQARADFVLTKIPDVKAQVLIVPNPLNIGRTGYFLALVKLPTGYKAADVDAGSVYCEDARALKIVRIKLFPQIFAAIFSRKDLGDYPTGTNQMNVRGTIKKSGGDVLFMGNNTIQVINKKVTTKEDVDSVMTMTDTQVFSNFNKF